MIPTDQRHFTLSEDVRLSYVGVNNADGLDTDST